MAKKKKYGKNVFMLFGVLIAAIILVVLIIALSPKIVVEQGDTVKVSYTGKFESGEIFDKGTLEFTLGLGEVVPGFENGVLGMRNNEKKEIVVPPEEGYGIRNVSLIQFWPRYGEMNKSDTLSLAVLSTLTKEEIVENATIRTFNLPWPILIKHINDSLVTFEHQAVLDSFYYDPLIMAWSTKILNITNTTIFFEYVPKIGTTLVSNGKVGRVVSIENETIAVDFNHELAGKTLIFDVKVIEIKKG